MEVSFASSQAKRFFESRAELQQTYGESCAKKVMARLADLQAAPALEEFRRLPGHCQELDGDRRGRLALELADGKRLVLEPSQQPAPLRGDGGLDWRLVDAVRVIDIADSRDGAARLENAQKR